MALILLKTILYRFVLPGALLIGALIRPSYISIAYVVFALIGPLLAPITPSAPISPALRVYFFLTLLTACAAFIAQFIYQIYAAVAEPNIDDYTKSCNTSVLNFWLRQIGLIRVKRNSGFNATRVILPEILAFAASLATTICCLVIRQNGDFETDQQTANVQPIRESSSYRESDKIRITEAMVLALKKLSDIAIILAVGMVGILQPCLLNSVYFTACLVVLTWWATYQPLQRHVYNTIKLLIICYGALHFLMIYIYQIPFFQTIIPGQSFPARLFGFVPILYTDCNNWWSLSIISLDYWTAFANAIAILVVYHLLIVQYNFTRYGVQREYAAYESAGSSVHEERVARPAYRASQGAGEAHSEETDMRPDEKRNFGIEEQRDNSLLADQDDTQRPENLPLHRINSSDVDRHKIAAVFVGPGESETATSQGLIAALAFVFHHFYVIALLAMMLWALLYHSVFGLIFLVDACVLWVFKDTRRVAFKFSPWILAYAEFLLVAQYVCSMDIKNELPPVLYMGLIGFVIAASRTEAFVTLLAKGLLSLPLFALLRLNRREKYYNSLTDREQPKRIYGTTAGSVDLPDNTEGAAETSRDVSLGVRIVSWLGECFAKYWIYVVSLVLLLISVQTPAVLYTVGYFVFFSVLITLLLVSLNCLRRLLYSYWTFLVIYSSAVLVVLYCYQFPAIPAIWRDATGLSDAWNRDIGLINYKQEGDTGALFVRLIAPISFFIVAMLQLKFFHHLWCQLVTATPLTTVNDTSVEAANEQPSLWAKAKHIMEGIREAIWSIAEVHLPKLVMLVLVIVAVNDICALNLAVMIFISLAVCIPAISSALSLFLCIFVSAFIALRMVYQMHFVIEKPLPVYSEEFICNSSEYTLDAAAYWLGFRKVPIIGNYVGGLIVVLVALAFQAIVIYRQRHKRLSSGTSVPPRGIVFPEADPKNWDASLVDMIKFFFNYGFYKFGLELSMTMMVVVTWVRMDFLATLLLLWLMVFVFTSRVTCRWLWPLFLLYLAILFPLQYAFYVGLPPILCHDYPWSHWLSNAEQNDNFIFWLDLPSFRFELDARKSVADFFLLLMVACQEYAFRSESSSPAGNNKSIYANGGRYDLQQDNPTLDFIAKQRSFVDFLKIIVFMYGQWITIVMVLVAGLGGVSLFALGYIILAFWMLWQGNSLYIAPNYRKALARWKLLLYYTVFVMFCKVALQVFACAFIHVLMKANLCYIRQLFSIVCVSTIPGRKSNYYFTDQQEFDNECTVQTSETQIGFDTFAFGFLVLQLRVLNSWYFQHCMVEYRSEAVLMDRGAILQDQLIEKEMVEQNEQQEKKFRDIKIRTEQIRKDYEKRLSQAGAFVPQTYGQGIESPDPDDPSPWYRLSDMRGRVDDLTPAKRAGDYYMFEYDPSQDALEKPVETFVPEVTPGAGEFHELDPAQLMHTAVQHDLDLAGTLGAVESAEQIKDEEKRMIKAVSEEGKPTDASEKTPVHSPTGEESKSGGQIVAALRFVQKLFASALGWCAAFLNRRSREYRYVAYVLEKEKEKLKERLKQESPEEVSGYPSKAYSAGPLVDPSRPVVDVRQEFDQQNLRCVSSTSDIKRLEGEVEDSWEQRNVCARFITAAGYCIAAHTDVICYLLAVIDHARCGGIISLPLPLMVFFWGSLTNPRPTKTFWVVMITYTELVVVIKFICQFGFFSWNNTASIIRGANSADYVPGILGVRKTDYYAFWDIALLVALFFHRYMLRKLGLWKEAGNTGNICETVQPVTQMSNNSDTLSNLPDGSQTDAHLDVAPVTEENPSCLQRFKNFFNMLFNPPVRYIRDLYPSMFLLDVLCFFVVSFGFSAFGYGGTGSVVRDIRSNRVPITFVVMLIVISLMIVVDRALYLRKAVKCKLIYQILIVIFIHIWIFFVLPQITYKPAWLNTTAQFLYFVKCVYLLISAWQIRNGYPALCAGNLITHAYGLSNMVFFKIFMNIPFLFELRTAIDWTWTDTSMPLFDFFNMENFYAVIYNLKCARTFERNFPAPRGVKKGVIVKYSMGVPMILILILIIWLPLLAFSLLNRIGIVLSPDNVMLTIGVEGYPSLFKIESQGIELEMLTDLEYRKLQDAFSEHYTSSDADSILRARHAVAFIKEYTLEDVMKVRFRPESQQPWLISSDALVAMKFELRNGTKELNAIIRIIFERPSSKDSKDPSQHTYTLNIPLPVNSTIRNELAGILDGQYTNQSMLLKHAWPPYVVVPNEGDVKPAFSLLSVIGEPNSTVQSGFSDISMNLTSGSFGAKVWSAELIEDNETVALTLPLEDVKYEAYTKKYKYMQMVVFVDRVFPSFVSKYVQGGIIAMYVAVVMLVGRMIRGIVTNGPLEVMISEIPNPDYLLKTCHDIYLVREAKDFVLEQDLFGKLIFLFRSPATLIKWTRNKAKAD